MKPEISFSTTNGNVVSYPLVPRVELRDPIDFPLVNVRRIANFKDLFLEVLPSIFLDRSLENNTRPQISGLMAAVLTHVYLSV